MENLLNKIDKNKLTIAYKLLHDVLFIVLFFFLLALVAEGVLPGIITAHVGFSKIVFLLFLVIFSIYTLGNNLKINLATSPLNKKTALFLLFILALLIFNSLLKLNILLNVFILVSILTTSYFTHKAILEE